ncbi:hypothetical protein EVA_14530 [gut metagenome]|uniref:Uncharacterized protein n=1 Tax=gut metagenome TaxID=749906 RepID=J9GDA5_9ZZZZ
MTEGFHGRNNAIPEKSCAVMTFRYLFHLFHQLFQLCHCQVGFL